MLIPATIQLVHAFEHHEHEIHGSVGLDDQFHEEAPHCILCDMQMDFVADTESPYTFEIPSSSFIFEQETFYNSYKKHSHSNYSLRGPPAC